MVHGVGFEPTRLSPAVLKTASLDHSDIRAHDLIHLGLSHVNWLQNTVSFLYKWKMRVYTLLFGFIFDFFEIRNTHTNIRSYFTITAGTPFRFTHLPSRCTYTCLGPAQQFVLPFRVNTFTHKAVGLRNISFESP